MLKIDEIWQNTREVLEHIVTAVSYDLWIKTLEPLDIKDDIFYLAAPSVIAKQRVIKLHETQIRDALSDVAPNIKDFVVFDPDEKENFLNKPISEEKEVSFTPLCKFIPKYTFDNFVVGNSNKYVYAAALGVAEHPFDKINPLYIYGGVGLGKTHLLHAIGNYLIKNNPELKILYVTCDQFTRDYVESLKSSNLQANIEYKEKYRTVDVLMIDDIQFIANRTGTQEEFFNTFNDLYQNQKQIIIASDRPPKEIASLEERLRSRFSMGLIQDIQTPDFETRLAILQKKAKQEKYNVDDEVINFIAERCDTNIRELEGMLSKVSFYASLTGKPSANMEDVNEALKDQVNTTKQNLTADRIIDCVCKYFSISKDDLVGKKKNKEIVEPRQICMYLICEMLDLPLVSVGQIFGGRDHTTVIHAREKISDMYKENNRIRVTINDIKSMANRT